MKTAYKRLVSFLLMVVLVAGGVAAFPTVARAANISYIDENGATVNIDSGTVTTLTGGGAATLGSSGTKWYIVTGNPVSYSGTLAVSGDVRLILANGSSLTVNGSNGNAGINLTGSNSLTIYAQSTDAGTMGRLTATGKTGTNSSSGYYVDAAGIGGPNSCSGGTLTVAGGNITANGSPHGAGIGGGQFGTIGTVNIRGGIVTANGGDWAAGIGGSQNSNGATVNIRGGIVTATGGTWAAGIGGGVRGAGGTVNISGGSVTAIAHNDDTGGGSGIGGGGEGGAGGSVTISGGFVTATGGTGGAGIGGAGGAYTYSNTRTGGAGGSVTISGGVVTATGGNGSAGVAGGSGIGGGGGSRDGTGANGGAGGSVTISGGSVTATGGSGIGGGNGANGSGGTVAITGGSVNAAIQSQPTNGAANNSRPVYKAAVVVPGVSAPTAVSSLTVTQSDALGYYSATGIQTDASGRFYLWLPAYTDNLTSVGFTAGGSYTCRGIVSANNSNLLSVSHSVTFEANTTDGTTGTMAPQTLYPGQALAANAFARAGYVFAGWGATAAATSAAYADGQAALLIDDTTLYALWLKTPVFSTQPATQTKTSGTAATFTVAADGGSLGTLSYQWQKYDGSSWQVISGAANSPSYAIPTLHVADTGGQYRCVLTNTLGSVQTAVESCTATLTVEQNTPTVSAPDASPASPADYPVGDIALTATLGSYFGTLGGQAIQFVDGGTVLGSATTDSSGVASCTWSNPAAGSYAVTAVFTGDTENAAVTGSTLDYTVNKGSQTALSLSLSSLAKTYGDAAFDVSALVSGGSGTGTLVYESGDSSVLTVDATGEVTLHKAGSATISIYNAADANYNQSNTVDIAVTVAYAAPTLSTPVAKPNALVRYPADVTLSATLGNYAGALSGHTIQFRNGGTVLGSAVTDASGVATCTWHSPRVGSYAITAAFAGDAGNAPAASDALTYTVLKGDQASLALSQTVLNKTEGDAAFYVSAFVSGGSGTGALVYNSSDSSVLTVSTAGLATIHKVGIALVSIYKAADGNMNQSNTVALAVVVAAKPATYTVTFNAQSGSVSPASKTVTYGGTYGALPTPTRTGHTFGGWYTGANGTGTKITATSTVSITANTTLYAKWTANTYTVIFNAQGGAVSPTSRTVTYGGTYGALPTPTRAGHTFGGWYTGAGGTGKRITATSTVSITANTTLYARWTINSYTVTFNAQGGSAVAAKTVQYNGLVPKPANPTRTGHTFGGWYKESACKNAWSFTADSITGSRTLYAKWTANKYAITVTPNSTGYGWVSGGGNIAYGTSITVRAIPKAGYRFVRWLEGASAVSLGAEYKFTVTKARTLKAEFAKIGTPVVTAASAGYSSVRLTWAAIAGAKEYEVYRATSSTGTYTRVATTAARSYTGAGLTTGKTYYYKVRAKCVASAATTYGAYSTVKSARPVPATATVTAARASATSIRLTWSAVTGATKYEVWRATSSAGTYAKLTETTATGYTGTGLTTGKTYYFKVRAYRLVNDTKVYGGYSAAVWAKP